MSCPRQLEPVDRKRILGIISEVRATLSRRIVQKRFPQQIRSTARRLVYWIRRRRRPETVFTPRSVVSGRRFIRREEPDLRGNASVERRLRNALVETGAQILIYGDAGVGKSSLLVNVAADAGLRLVRVRCLSGRTYDDVMRDALGQMLTILETGLSVTDTDEVQHESGIGAKALSIKGTYKRSYGRTRTFEAVRREPADVLLDAMDATGHDVVVLDNFQNLDDGQNRLLIMQTMERLSDQAGDTGNKKICIIGIAQDSKDLVAGSPSFARRVIEVGVPRMPDYEIGQIFEFGFRSLGLDLQDGALSRLIFYADGFPYFAHLLGLEAARLARESRLAEVSSDLLATALARVAQQIEQAYEERVGRAVESQGDLQPRRRVLEVLARSPHRQWTSRGVSEMWANYFADQRDDWNFLLTALTQLTSEKFGAILQRSGPPGNYIYTFSDPHLRPYLRLAMFETPLESTVRGLRPGRLRRRSESRTLPRSARPDSGGTPDLSMAMSLAREWGGSTGGALVFDEIAFTAEVDALIRADRSSTDDDWAPESVAIGGPRDDPALVIFIQTGTGTHKRRVAWSWPLRGDPLDALVPEDAVEALREFRSSHRETEVLGEDDDGTQYYRARRPGPR